MKNVLQFLLILLVLALGNGIPGAAANEQGRQSGESLYTDSQTGSERQEQTANEWYLNAMRLKRERDFEGAIREFSNAISMEPEEPIYYLNRGVTLSFLEQFEQAIDDFDRTLELDPGFVSAYTARGAARRRTSDLEGALADFDLAISVSHTDEKVENAIARSSAYLHRGSLLLRLGRTEEAIQQLDEALSESTFPLLYMLHTVKGHALLVAGRNNEAIAAYDASIETISEQPMALMGRAVVRYRLGEQEEGDADCLKANQLSDESVLCDDLEDFVLRVLLEE